MPDNAIKGVKGKQKTETKGKKEYGKSRKEIGKYRNS